MDRVKLIAFAEATAAVIVWGASFIATKVALRDVSPVTVVWLRVAMGVVIIGVAVVARKQFAFVPLKELGYFALLGFVGITLHQWLQSNGLVTAQATTTAWIVATTPIFMAVLGWMLLKERFEWPLVAGIAAAAFGVLLVATKGDFGSLTAGRFGAPGDFLILISAPNWALFSALSRRGLGRHPAARMMFYVMTLGWAFTSVMLFAGPGLSEIPRLTLNGWLGVGFLGVFCSGLAYIFWYDALQVIPASQLAVFLYVEPLVAVVVAAAILRERITPPALLGGAIILFGVWIVNRPTRSSTD